MSLCHKLQAFTPMNVGGERRVTGLVEDLCGESVESQWGNRVGYDGDDGTYRTVNQSLEYQK